MADNVLKNEKEAFIGIRVLLGMKRISNMIISLNKYKLLKLPTYRFQGNLGHVYILKRQTRNNKNVSVT